MPETCGACTRGAGALCPRCLDLVDGVVEVRRSVVLEFAYFFLTIERLLGRSDVFPLPEVRSERGQVVHVPDNTRYDMTETTFPGAPLFHRALAARRWQAGLLVRG